METFLQLIESIGTGVPDWLPLIFLPCALITVAVIMTVLGGRKLYKYFAASIGGVGFFLLVCIGGVREAFVYLGLYVVLAVLLRLLFFIPLPRTYRKSGRGEREEKIYRKFREALSEQVTEESGRNVLPAGCAFEEEVPALTAEESGMRFQHVTELLAKLKKEELSAADRLETDALARSVEAFRNKALTEEEMCVLNDCLAAVLKLTAKYQL